MKHAAKKKKKKRSRPPKAPCNSATNDEQREQQQQELHRQEQEQQEQGRILDSLVEAFDSVSLAEAASAYEQAGLRQSKVSWPSVRRISALAFSSAKVAEMSQQKLTAVVTVTEMIWRTKSATWRPGLRSARGLSKQVPAVPDRNRKLMNENHHSPLQNPRPISCQQ
ncbi:hypothetical protein SLEP1_g35552 [Rubroshorea leprosula]|uniref:At5g58720/SDE5-like UBA-like domain-containing protein n=1 Tax=Rubroshorea leprosula TaxID=152421 RepID=A0AAV5KNN0_9ROSI|nr:hypothetical protein SLEP1_g35552 [Rubroshorea leprosula]